MGNLKVVSGTKCCGQCPYTRMGSVRGNPVKWQEILRNHPWKWLFVRVTKAVDLSLERQKEISLQLLSVVPLPLGQCWERRPEAWDAPKAVKEHGLKWSPFFLWRSSRGECRAAVHIYVSVKFMCILYAPMSLGPARSGTAVCGRHLPASGRFPPFPALLPPLSVGHGWAVRGFGWWGSREGIWLRREPPAQAAGILSCGRCPHAVLHVTHIYPSLFLSFSKGEPSSGPRGNILCAVGRFPLRGDARSSLSVSDWVNTSRDFFQGTLFSISSYSNPGLPSQCSQPWSLVCGAEVTHCSSPLWREHTARKAWICPVGTAGLRQAALSPGVCELGMHPEGPGELSHPLRSNSPHGVTGSVWAHLDRCQRLRKKSLCQNFFTNRYRSSLFKLYLTYVYKSQREI